MARLLSIQSQVIYGHVGNSAAAFALERLGHEVLAVPTVLLPHHPGHGPVKAAPTAPDTLSSWIDTMRARGWLEDCRAVITGYFANADQIPPVAEAIAGLKKRNPDLIYLCDPVFGDLEKKYFLPRDVAEAIKAHLLPLADLTTPNLFEASELAGRAIRDQTGALRAAAELGPPGVIVTSLPVDEPVPGRQIGTLYWQRPGDWKTPGGRPKTGSWFLSAPRQTRAPHGTGDLFAALVVGHMLNQLPMPAALRRASAALSDLVATAAAEDLDELPLTAEQKALLQPISAVGLTPLGAGAEGQWVAGADACAGGWLVVLTDMSGRTPFRYRLCRTFAEVMALPERPSVIAVDVPVGLPDVAVRGGRPCDTAARARLGARRSLVLTPPARAALDAETFNEACEVNLKHSVPPRKVSKHTFGIFSKIREVDGAVGPDEQVRVFECHPELAYWAMNGEKPVPVPKRVKNAPHAEGLDVRRGLLAANGFDVKFLAGFEMSRHKAGLEDFLDACACAFTAARIARGEAVQLPQDPGRDGRGLRMEIWG